MNPTAATILALALWATTSAAIVAGAFALQYRTRANQATARARRAYDELASERNRNAEHMRQHSATLTRAANHIDRLAAIIQSQPDERAAVADLTAQNEALRQRALEAMQDALYANLPRYAIRSPGLLHARRQSRN